VEAVDVPALAAALWPGEGESQRQRFMRSFDLDPHATTIVADSLAQAVQFAVQCTEVYEAGNCYLQVKHEGVFLHFTVWDTGIGISAEEQAQLFQPYSQIANVVAGRQEGTGLGLALTQKLAELHSGWQKLSPKSITVHSLLLYFLYTSSAGRWEQRSREGGVPTQSG